MSEHEIRHAEIRHAEILQGIGEVARRHLRRESASPGLARLLAGEGAPDPSLRLVEDLELDSLELLTLAVEVENRFRVMLDGPAVDGEAEGEDGPQGDGSAAAPVAPSIETLGDLAAAVAAQLAGPSPEPAP